MRNGAFSGPYRESSRPTTCKTCERTTDTGVVPQHSSVTAAAGFLMAGVFKSGDFNAFDKVTAQAIRVLLFFFFLQHHPLGFTEATVSLHCLRFL